MKILNENILLLTLISSSAFNVVIFVAMEQFKFFLASFVSMTVYCHVQAMRMVKHQIRVLMPYKRIERNAFLT